MKPRPIGSEQQTAGTHKSASKCEHAFGNTRTQIVAGGYPHCQTHNGHGINQADAGAIRLQAKLQGLKQNAKSVNGPKYETQQKGAAKGRDI